MHEIRDPKLPEVPPAAPFVVDDDPALLPFSGLRLDRDHEKTDREDPYVTVSVKFRRDDHELLVAHAREQYTPVRTLVRKQCQPLLDELRKCD